LCRNYSKYGKTCRGFELFIKLDVKDKHIVLTTEDNGKGFNYEKINEMNKGLGLRNLASRVEIMNGISAVDTGAGERSKI
jgi:signal transduction histidine kinase